MKQTAVFALLLAVPLGLLGAWASPPQEAQDMILRVTSTEAGQTVFFEEARVFTDDERSVDKETRSIELHGERLVFQRHTTPFEVHVTPEQGREFVGVFRALEDGAELRVELFYPGRAGREQVLEGWGRALVMQKSAERNRITAF